MGTIELSAQQLREMQQKSWEMYRYFAEFCQQHNLLFYACGGCCIGAIRHKGFIPWDDDIDIFMPRPDYEKLAKLWNEKADTQRYCYVRSDKDLNTADLMAKICDRNTTLITTYQLGKDMPQGLTMDILPLDGCPKPGSYRRKLQKLYALLFSLYCAQTVPQNHGKILATGAKALLAVVPSQKLRYYLWRFFQKRMTAIPFGSTKWVTELCSGPKYMQNEYEYAWFSKAKTVEFEDSTIQIPIGYDEYLRFAFGDYLALPPEDKQKPHHDLAVLDLETPYETYLAKS